jgi:energy-coupling factor transporter ATP-binding protein EcfA2
MIIAIWDTKGENVPFFKQEQKALMPKDETQNPYEQQLQAEVKEKIDQPLFESSLRLLLCSTDPKQTNSRISGFLASFGSLGSAYQSLVLRARSFISLLPSPRLAFATRQVSFAGNPILSASELTDIYHFPYTETTKTEDMVKAKNQPLPAPLSFKQTATQLDNVFATNSYGGSETAIGQTLQERQRHTYILGATGSGKTTLLSNMIYQDIINGKGVAVLDPHGQLIEKLLEVIPKERIKDVVWFAPDDHEYPISLNLFDLPKGDSISLSLLQKQKSLVASSIISIFQKFYDAKYFGPRMEYVLRNAILTALETENPTLLTILDLLTKKSYRKEIVKGLDNKILKDYWLNEFEKLGSMQRNNVISPITNKVGGILSSPINYNILTQPKSTINFDQIMNEGKILLCDLSKGKIGEDESSFFGSLVIAKIQLAALRRALIPEESRRDFFLYVDEFQNFATQSFSELVSEARKYHLATILAHQSISQIEDRDIIKVILANVGTVICFKTANPEDEQFILPIFSPEVLKH